MSKNTEYIDGLNYDLKKLLTVNLQTETQPDSNLENRQIFPGSVRVCKKTPHGVMKDLTDNSLLDPTQGVIFPGAILKQNENLALGLPTPYTFARSPLTIRVLLPGLEEKGNAIIDSPTNVSVQTAIDKIVDYWHNNFGNNDYVVPVRAFSNSCKAYTKEQIGIQLGFGMQLDKFSTTASLNYKSNVESTTTFKVFRQIYYSVIVEEPKESGDFFTENVILNPKNMAESDPPGFVRSVNYGRTIIVQMTTKKQLRDIDASLTLEYSLGGKDDKIDADTKAKYESIKNDSSFTAIVLGGGSESTGILIEEIDKINDAISHGLSFSKKTPAVPVSYVVADVKSRQNSTMRLSTEYVETICEMYYNRSITLKHGGAYVANFLIDWFETDSNGQPVSRHYESGNVTASWVTKLDFPGDATNIKITLHDYTGIAWSPVYKLFLTFPVLDGNKVVECTGTTLNPYLQDITNNH